MCSTHTLHRQRLFSAEEYFSVYSLGAEYTTPPLPPNTEPINFIYWNGASTVVQL